MNLEDVKKQEIAWKDLVAKSEMVNLRLITEDAKKELERKIANFIIARKQAIASGNTSFIFRDKTYNIDEETINTVMTGWANPSSVSKHRALLAYRRAETNAWIYKTLLDKKRTSLFKTCKNLVLVGSGMYPYSMFDIQKKYKHIQQIGIEIDEKRASVGREIVTKSPAKDHIHIITCDGYDYDYTYLLEDDLVFISCDVDNKNMMSKIMETCKAHMFICAPYEKTWLRALVQSIKVSKHHGVIFYAD